VGNDYALDPETASFLSTGLQRARLEGRCFALVLRASCLSLVCLSSC